MKLMNKTLEKALPKLYATEKVDAADKIIQVHYFNPSGAGNWYAVEYSPEDRLFFGYVSIFGDECDEWGYFSLDELEGYKPKFGLPIERDLYWKPIPFSQLKR